MEAEVLIVFALGAGFVVGWMVREARVRAPDQVAGHLAEMALEVAAELPEPDEEEFLAMLARARMAPNRRTPYVLDVMRLGAALLKQQVV